MPRRQLLVGLLAAIVGASCHRLVPAAHPPFTITGVVESVDPQGLRLRHKSGQKVSISFTPQTIFTKNNGPADVADVKTQMRIVVVYHFAGDAPMADEVRLFRTKREPPARTTQADEERVTEFGGGSV